VKTKECFRKKNIPKIEVVVVKTYSQKVRLDKENPLNKFKKVNEQIAVFGLFVLNTN
jgi:hypothetical protein